ncbi:hypothetical protein COF68_08600 [Bacillus toyonensis]|nr:hypothetical protein COO05_04290 [Bacillus toyonensis]PEC38362.1 hypothetical protein CON60_16470 [Bacillus toyonensis]PED60878.1 hypothetical protein CON89_13105 [Bacillus toyonensis]PEE83001.1 hypothetical protein COO15_09750 [Bacillus toyonensis]PEJ91298.1 hypothetical protein CN687_20255 [Bacillus toyonensis]
MKSKKRLAFANLFLWKWICNFSVTIFYSRKIILICMRLLDKQKVKINTVIRKDNICKNG